MQPFKQTSPTARYQAKQQAEQREQDPTPMTEQQRHQQHLIFTAILTGDTDHLNRIDLNDNDLYITAQFLTQEWQKTHTPQTQTRHMIDLIPNTHDREQIAEAYTAHIHNNPYPPSHTTNN